MSNLQRNLLKSRLPPMAPRSMQKASSSRQKNYSPNSWDKYFSECKNITLNQGTFRVYFSEKPDIDNNLVICLLHGGGFSSLTWSLFTKEITDIVNCQVLSIDFRGHGETTTLDDDDLCAETLSHDIVDVLQKIYPENPPNILLMGHSMGGAICVHTAHLNLLRSLIGVVVIDVVEGTAIESLQSMQSFLRSRPNYFKSIPMAIEWSIRSGQIKNLESAKVSMPGQIVNCHTKKLAINEICNDEKLTEPSEIKNPLSIPEDEEMSNSSDFKSPTDENKKYTWRIDLSKSEKHWMGWFEGLSSKFLNLNVPKLLILAGIDNLDKTMTVGQMQGKFQLQIMARTGHVVHEDKPHDVAEVVGSYIVRNRFADARHDFVRQMPAC